TSTLTWDVSPSILLGNGYVSLQVINTDQDYISSNLVGTVLLGATAVGFPQITEINGTGLGPVSTGVPMNYVETVAPRNSTVTISGGGFNLPVVNLYTAEGNVGPLVPLAGDTANQLQVIVPGTAPAGPGSFQVINTGSNYLASNAVSVPIGAAITVTSVGQVGATVTVDGTGFSSLTVINLFNLTPGGVANLGGFDGAGQPNVPLTLVSENRFTFTAPAGASAGAAYVQALNPPFIPFSSSGNAPGGSFNITLN
ncbi:MAG: hypothetical protein ABGY42_08275, partial [bacterium]